MDLGMSGWFKWFIVYLVIMQQSGIWSHETTCFRISTFWQNYCNRYQDYWVYRTAFIGGFSGFDFPVLLFLTHSTMTIQNTLSLFWVLHPTWYIAVYMKYKDSLFPDKWIHLISVCVEPRRTLLSPMFTWWYHPLLFAPIVVYFLLDADK